MYSTPTRFRTGGYGFDVSAMSDAQLRAYLQRASDTVDSWCALSMIPGPSSFRGGRVVKEQHEWKQFEPLQPRPGDRRVFLNRRPIIQIEAFSIVFTNSYRLDIPPSNLYVNNESGYIEIVASQPTIVGYPPLGYWIGLYEPITETTYTYGWRFEVSETLYSTTPTSYVGTHPFWDTTSPVTVQVNGVTQPASSYTVNYEEGMVTFGTSPSGTVTATYTATLPHAIVEATSLIAVDLMSEARNAARGLSGLSSLRVEQVELRTLRPQDYVVRNGVSIPRLAAELLAPYARGAV